MHVHLVPFTEVEISAQVPTSYNLPLSDVNQRIDFSLPSFHTFLIESLGKILVTFYRVWFH